MALLFCDLPGDILLGIARYLPLEDVAALSVTCSVFQELSSSRSMWIYALESTRRIRPVPCLTHQDLSELDLTSLKNMAFHALRLKRNWSRPSPRIIGDIKVAQILDGGPVQIIATIPGTPLVIFHLLDKREAVCWDTSSSTALDTVYIGDYVFDLSQPYEQCGKFMIALVTYCVAAERNPLKRRFIRVLSLQYGGNRRATMRESFCWGFTEDFDIYHAFVYEDVVGACRTSLNDKFIVAQNMRTGVSVQYNCDAYTYGTISHSSCYVFDGHLYISTDSGDALQTHRYDRELFPYGDHHGNKETFTGPSITAPTAFNRVDGPDSRRVYLMPGISSYGINAISIRDHCGFQSPYVTTIRIFPCSKSESGECSLAHHDSTELTTHFLGSVRAVQGFCLTPWQSECSLLILMSSGSSDEPPFYLRLIRYDGEAGSMSDHILSLPPFLNLGAIAALALDEHRGVVLLVDISGMLIKIPYA